MSEAIAAPVAAPPPAPNAPGEPAAPKQAAPVVAQSSGSSPEVRADARAISQQGGQPRKEDGKFASPFGEKAKAEATPEMTPAQATAAAKRKYDLKVFGEARSLELEEGTAKQLADLFDQRLWRMAIARAVRPK